MKEDLRIKYKTSLEKTDNIETEDSVLFNGNTTTIPTWTHVQNRVQTHVKNHIPNHVQNLVRKIKNTANKNISLQKIADPKKRDFIVNEFLKTRQNIQQNFLSERLGHLSKQYELSKLFKPVTDMEKDLKEGHVSEMKPIRERMKNLPKAITFLQFPSITAYDDDGEEEKDVFIWDISEQYLRKFAIASGED